jgi:spermidine/putrescine-binding protein
VRLNFVRLSGPANFSNCSDSPLGKRPKTAGIARHRTHLERTARFAPTRQSSSDLALFTVHAEARTKLGSSSRPPEVGKKGVIMSFETPEERDHVQRLEEIRLSRLELLKRGGVTALVLAGPAFLASCGSSGSSTSGEVGGSLDFLSWQGYDLPGVMKQWKKAHGVRVRATYIALQDDVQAKLKAGGAKGTDVITYYQGDKPLYDQLGILTKLDTEKLPNLDGLISFFGGDEKNFWVDPDGSRTGVPWTWGAAGITYDSSVIKSPPTSYSDLFDPKYKGKVTMTDDMVGALNQAAVMAKVNPAQLPKSDLTKITDIWEKMIAQTKGLAASYGDCASRLASGDANVSFLGWAAMNVFAAQAGNKNIKSTIPKEGGGFFCDAWAIPPGADNVDTSLAWINQTIDPTINAKAAEELVGGPTVKASIDKLNDATKSLYPYKDIDSFLGNAEFFNLPPVKSDQYVTYSKFNSAWEQAKASAKS